MVWPMAARQDMCSMMLKAAKASRPVVGSSRNSSEGCAISAHAMLNLRFSPPAFPQWDSHGCTTTAEKDYLRVQSAASLLP